MIKLKYLSVGRRMHFYVCLLNKCMPTLCCNKTTQILIAVVLIEKHEHTLKKIHFLLNFFVLFPAKISNNS